MIGVAALAPASDLTGLVDNLGTVPGGSIFASFVMDGYTKTYPDVKLDDYVRPALRTQVVEAAKRCLAEPSALVSVADSLVLNGPIYADEPSTGALGRRLEENVPRGPIPVPLLIGQGETDQLVLPTAQADYVQQRCAAGQPVDYRTYPDRDHVGVVAADSPLVPDLLAWTQDRFSGAPTTDTCAGG